MAQGLSFMIRSELIAKVANCNAHMSLLAVERAVAIIFDEIVRALAKGQRVELRGFGSFTPKKKNPHVWHNPRTVTPVKIASKNIPSFKAGQKLNVRLNP